jgi:hypothetical protein
MAYKPPYKKGWLKQQGVAVYTGSRKGSNPIYAQNAAEVGRILPANGYKNIYYGAGDAGTMGVVARSAIRFGARVHGITLDFFKAAQGEDLPGAVPSKVVDTFHARIEDMRGNSGACVTLPGSYGTMEEAFEWITSSNGILKPLIWQNLEGHWNGALRQMQRCIDEGFETPYLKDRFEVAVTPKDILRALKDINRRKPQDDDAPTRPANDADYIEENRHCLIVEPAPLVTIGRLMSRIVTYDISNIEGQTVFTDPEDIIRPAIFVSDFYEGLHEQVYHVIGTGHSPDERGKFFHFVDTRAEAEELRKKLDNEVPLTPKDLKKKHQEAMSLEAQRSTHPSLESL